MTEEMEEESEPRVRELWSARDRRELEEFLAAVRGEDLVGALFAVEGVPARTAAAGRALLDGWARRVSVLGPAPAVASPRELALALTSVLGGELGFRGDDADYHHPRNSLLHEVLTSRRGMPILLSSVFMAVGRRAGIRVSGLGLPGHFVVRIGGSDGVLVDPFDGGAELTVADCRRKVEETSGGRVAWSEEFLRASRIDEILERVLQNLFLSYRRQMDGAGCFRAASFLAALRPDSPERRIAVAEVADSVGARELAAELYTALVEAFPDSPESETAAEKLRGFEDAQAVN